MAKRALLHLPPLWTNASLPLIRCCTTPLPCQVGEPSSVMTWTVALGMKARIDAKKAKPTSRRVPVLGAGRETVSHVDA